MVIRAVQVLSLPVYPALRDQDIDFVAATLKGHHACAH
jgi:hypothetical protein